ncbi:MAG: outer membrane protein assembly factor BamD [Verrucomicrobiota bacterium]|nr:outer membrane protein assembly factor BamD [Limisphaera sp.]MDW8381467.1 outer membrane protein assembly factor BamD [Verrucomicrobiota bacterium]
MAVLLTGLIWPGSAPAPLIYTPGEGWTYEPVGSEGRWRRARAKDQLDVAQEAFERGEYGLALKAARRVVRQWPLSDYAPEAQFLIARCFEARKQDERAFREYQKFIEKYPMSDQFNEALRRQYEIALRFLGGQWFKLWGYIPFFPSMSKTAEMLEKVVANGPYSDIGPAAQMSLGTAYEKARDYDLAVKAYETAADRYSDRPQVAADALYRAGLAWLKQARTAEYDQSAAGKAIAVFTDFMALYPNDPRAVEARDHIAALRAEQARGHYEIARFYEKRRQWAGALIYYNEVLLLDPTSRYAEEARERIEALKPRVRPSQTTAQVQP